MLYICSFEWQPERCSYVGRVFVAAGAQKSATECRTRAITMHSQMPRREQMRRSPIPSPISRIHSWRGSSPNTRHRFPFPGALLIHAAARGGCILFSTARVPLRADPPSDSFMGDGWMKWGKKEATHKRDADICKYMRESCLWENFCILVCKCIPMVRCAWVSNWVTYAQILVSEN